VNSNSYYATNPGSIQYNQQMAYGSFFSISYTLFSPKYTGSVQTGNISGSAGSPAQNAPAASPAYSASTPAAPPPAAAASTP
jgi:hypothetical protein